MRGPDAALPARRLHSFMVMACNIVTARNGSRDSRYAMRAHCGVNSSAWMGPKPESSSKNCGRRRLGHLNARTLPRFG